MGKSAARVRAAASPAKRKNHPWGSAVAAEVAFSLRRRVGPLNFSVELRTPWGLNMILQTHGARGPWSWYLTSPCCGDRVNEKHRCVNCGRESAVLSGIADVNSLNLFHAMLNHRLEPFKMNVLTQDLWLQELETFFTLLDGPILQAHREHDSEQVEFLLAETARDWNRLFTALIIH